VSNESIFFFDGVCGLCNRNVDFILRHDRNRKFKFVALQDQKALKILSSAGLPPPDYSSSILFQDGQFYYKSDVYFAIFSALGMPWSMITPLRLIPKSLRDKVYDCVAANRYRVFGKLESCRAATGNEKERFL
jgi:predicted DCC family thiol-disulfide oxidoreductase YuxK